MEILDPSIRRALQVVSYQRDELFNRRPNIIPTSLKMLVEPNPSERTLAFLESVIDETFLVSAGEKDVCINSDVDDVNNDVIRAITEVRLVSERISLLREKYSRLHYHRHTASNFQLDAAISKCQIDSDRLCRVKVYYDDLLTLNKELSSNSGRMLSSEERASVEIDEAQMAYNEELIAALRAVSWH